MKLLLTSAFGPYGIDDEFGRKTNKMELFHSQVTREQGLFSYRFNHESFGLHMLAENIPAHSTILDFPTLRRFKKELKNNYDYVGISFIVPNMKKAQEMARLVRKLSPQSKIILGGHGTSIPDIESMVEHDYICRGEGVRFMRKLLGGCNLDQSIKHPIVYSSFNRRIMGVPLPKTSGVLIPGVGCPNQCHFCATSHFFQDYIPYLPTGKNLFDVCCDYEKKLGVRDFGIQDENFLKFKERALELVDLMEKNNRHFTFGIFSSAETLQSLGDLDILVRLGVQFVWIGVESKRQVFEKNKGTNFPWLVKELRRRGICVLTSVILFHEHHDKNTIFEDVNFGIELNSDYVQYSQLGPLPGTPLYKDYESKGKLLSVTEAPWEDRHGEEKIWFSHPHFTRDESETYLLDAFKQEYTANGASFIRAIRTYLNGYLYCRDHTDPKIKCRAQDYKSMLELVRYFLPTAWFFSENKKTRELLSGIRKDLTSAGFRFNIKTLLLQGFVFSMASKEWIRIKTIGDVIQPKTKVSQYPPTFISVEQDIKNSINEILAASCFQDKASSNSSCSL